MTGGTWALAVGRLVADEAEFQVSHSLHSPNHAFKLLVLRTGRRAIGNLHIDNDLRAIVGDEPDKMLCPAPMNQFIDASLDSGRVGRDGS